MVGASYFFETKMEGKPFSYRAFGKWFITASAVHLFAKSSVHTILFERLKLDLPSWQKSLQMNPMNGPSKALNLGDRKAV